MTSNLQPDFFSKLIDELEDYAFLFLDLEGNIQSWNIGAKNIKGYCTEEIIGKNFSCFYTQEDQILKKPENLLAIAFSKGKVQDQGWRIRKDGTSFWGMTTITAIHDNKGNTIGFGKLTRDLTQRKLAEQATIVEIKNKELEQFTYIASHDLQEPLRTVSNYTQLLKEDFSSILNDDAKNYLQAIEYATNRMSMLIRCLLDFSRLGRNKKIAQVNCNLLINQILADLHNLIEENGAQVTVGELYILNAYETEIRQLFQNLISNALKFTKANTPVEIKIGATKNSSFIEYYISDNGIGIDHKYHDRIFQIFKRLNKEQEFDGYGIGLANSKKIIEMHNGKIWVESTLGVGSIFKFTISTTIQ